MDTNVGIVANIHFYREHKKWMKVKVVRHKAIQKLPSIKV